MFPYKTPGAYKQALTNRIKERAQTRSMVFNRYQQLVIFDRFLDRTYTSCGDAVILKGGYVMELRLNRARTTKDIDFRGMGDVDQLLSKIRQVASQVGPDFMSFEAYSEANRLPMKVEDLEFKRCSPGKRLVSTFNAEDLSRSIHATFGLRATHEIPAKLPNPPTRNVYDRVGSIRKAVLRALWTDDPARMSASVLPARPALTES